MTNKYDPLGEFLKAQPSHRVPLSFAEIEKIIGDDLPSSAYKHRPWWSNNPSNNVMTKVWIAAGFESEQVDMEGQRLTFNRKHHTSVPASITAPPPQSGSQTPRRSPLFGALKGTFSFEAGYDPKEPALAAEEWVEILKTKYEKYNRPGPKG